MAVLYFQAFLGCLEVAAQVLCFEGACDMESKACGYDGETTFANAGCVIFSGGALTKVKECFPK